ncbi:MAG TPA: DUF433 domain-containing protein [Planctomycetota bacterium]|nr:DUF433 domain-containing protein [Planctomycetota bacterium]
MHWQGRITLNPEILVGKPCIKDTRIAVEFVIELLADGWTCEQILESRDGCARSHSAQPDPPLSSP